VIDDSLGCTLAAISTLNPEIRQQLNGAGANVEAAKLVGAKIAELCKQKNIEKVRRGCALHSIFVWSLAGIGAIAAEALRVVCTESVASFIQRPWPRFSMRRCASTAAASATMAVCKRWRMPRARQA
jgi:hypothetical protein